MLSGKIHKPYDSHVHLFATGEIASIIDLRNVRSAKELKARDTGVRRSEWIYGFGWDENLFDKEFSLKKETLDNVFGETPVFLSRCDGHSSWVNSAGLRALEKVLENSVSKLNTESLDRGRALETGHLKETYHIEALKILPEWSSIQVKDFVFKAQSIFHQVGVTHVREMTGLLFQFHLLQEMEREGTLKLSVDFNFLCDRPEDLEKLLKEIKSLKSSRYVKIRGIKIFVDGSLGSETALLSQAYAHLKTDSDNRGLLLWTLEEIESAWTQVFQNKLEVCFHSIGDETTHQLVQIGRKISQRGHVGRTNFEHVEVLRPETIQAMKPLHVRCHMQPVYWNTDKAWLREKLGTLYKHAFPWESLRKSQIPLQFGSDSPIEPPGIHLNVNALEASFREGRIPRFQGEPLQFHTNPYEDVVDSVATWKSGELESLIFDGQELL